MSADLHPTAQQLCAAAGISRRMFFNALKVRRNGKQCKPGRYELTARGRETLREWGLGAA